MKKIERIVTPLLKMPNLQEFSEFLTSQYESLETNLNNNKNTLKSTLQERAFAELKKQGETFILDTFSQKTEAATLDENSIETYLKGINSSPFEKLEKDATQIAVTPQDQPVESPQSDYSQKKLLDDLVHLAQADKAVFDEFTSIKAKIEAEEVLSKLVDTNNDHDQTINGFNKGLEGHPDQDDQQGRFIQGLTDQLTQAKQQRIQVLRQDIAGEFIEKINDHTELATLETKFSDSNINQALNVLDEGQQDAVVQGLKTQLTQAKERRIKELRQEITDEFIEKISTHSELSTLETEFSDSIINETLNVLDVADQEDQFIKGLKDQLTQEKAQKTQQLRGAITRKIIEEINAKNDLSRLKRADTASPFSDKKLRERLVINSEDFIPSEITLEKEKQIQQLRDAIAREIIEEINAHPDVSSLESLFSDENLRERLVINSEESIPPDITQTLEARKTLLIGINKNLEICNANLGVIATFETTRTQYETKATVIDAMIDTLGISGTGLEELCEEAEKIEDQKVILKAQKQKLENKQEVLIEAITHKTIETFYKDYHDQKEQLESIKKKLEKKIKSLKDTISGFTTQPSNESKLSTN